MITSYFRSYEQKGGSTMSYIMTEVFINVTSTLIVYFIIKLIEKNKDKN